MGTGFSKKKKQARAMQEQFVRMQEEIEKLEVTGSAGNGLVEITLSGDSSMKKITIKPECVDPDDIEGLQDLIISAHNDAESKLKKASSKGMPGMPAGLGLPAGLF